MPSEPLDLEVLPALGRSSGPLKKRGRIRSSEWLLEHELRVAELLDELFRLHDLDGDGVLQEAELIRLNEQIAVMHHGEDVDLGSVRAKYRELFRSSLNADGQPVSCDTFCEYTRKVLDGLDADPVAQEMILEQWSVEAQTCRELFPAWSPHFGLARLQCSQGLAAQVPKPVSVDSDRELTSTADESLADTGADSDSDTIPLCGAGGRSILGRGPRSNEGGDTDEEGSSQATQELPRGCQVGETQQPEQGSGSPVVHI